MEKINTVVLLAVSLATTVVYSALRNQYSKKHGKTHGDFYLINALASIFTVVAIIVLSGGFSTPSTYTLALGTLFGVITSLQTIFTLFALGLGPMSYTTVIFTSSMIIPSLSGRIIWDETVSAWQYVGVALMLLTMILAVDSKSDNEKKASIKWLCFCVAGFFCSGAIGVLQKVHQNSPHAGELNAFLVAAFAVSAIFSFVLYLIDTRVRLTPKTVRIALNPKKDPTLLMALIIGFCVAFPNLINLYLSGIMDSVIFFPIVNGGSLVLSTAVALVIFKERLTKKQWVGMAIGAVSILLLCNIF